MCVCNSCSTSCKQNSLRRAGNHALRPKTFSLECFFRAWVCIRTRVWIRTRMQMCLFPCICRVQKTYMHMWMCQSDYNCIYGRACEYITSTESTSLFLTLITTESVLEGSIRKEGKIRDTRGKTTCSDEAKGEEEEKKKKQEGREEKMWMNIRIRANTPPDRASEEDVGSCGARVWKLDLGEGREGWQGEANKAWRGEEKHTRGRSGGGGGKWGVRREEEKTAWLPLRTPSGSTGSN